MSNKKILLLSLLLGLLAAGAIYFYISKAVAMNTTYKEVVVADTNIPANTTITSSMVQLKRYPVGYVNNGANYNLSNVIGKKTGNYISDGEQVLKTDLTTKGHGTSVSSDMAENVTTGKRALTVSVTQVTGVNGFLKNGDHVDIAVTADVDLQNGQAKKTVNKIIAYDIEVLAVDKGVQKEDKKSDAANNAEIKTVTLLVPLDKTESIMLGNDKGILHLLLRSPSDKKNDIVGPVFPDIFLN